jgi:hypothetical protein
MAFFLIGRGPEDDLRVLSESFFESRQEAMAELSRLSADPEFSQWDTDVFVLDLEQGVPVLLVRPQSAELPMSAAEPIVAEAPEAAEDAVEEPTSVVQVQEDAEPSGLRDAILRTTEQMSAEGIVPPASAGLGATEEAIEAEAEAASSADASEVEPEAVSEEETQTAAEAEPDAGADSAWPWAATPPTPESDTDAVSPDIATVYEALEEEASADLVPEAAAEGEPGPVATDAEVAPDDSDFILDLDAIQPVALDENPAQEDGAEVPAAAQETPEPIPAETPSEDSYSSTLTDYTCEDCVYVETCPNRDQRAPKDCGSFQWK